MKNKDVLTQMQRRFSQGASMESDGGEAGVAAEEDGHASLEVMGGDLTALLNQSDVNKSTEDILVQEASTEGTEPRRYESCAVYTFWKNVPTKPFTAVSDGVSVCPLTSSEGLMRVELGAVTRTTRHDSDIRLIVFEGDLLLSINGTQSLHAPLDVVRVPAGTAYKIRNVAKGGRATLFFDFSN